MTHGVRWWVFVAVVVIAGMTATGCSGSDDSRSVAKFCSVMAKHKDRYEAAMESATNSGNILSGGVQAIGALGDLNQMWTELADVAPNDIKVDVDAVAKVYAKSFDDAGDVIANPLAGLGSSLMSSLATAGPTKRVGEYAEANCPGVGSPF